MVMTKNESPRIYVASLSDYNNGLLHGVWIDAAQDADSIRDEIAAMLRESKCPNVDVECPDCNGDGVIEAGEFGFHGCETCGGSGQGQATCAGRGRVPSAEEWAIHDTEGFGDIHIGEGESIDKIAELAELIQEHGEAYSAYADMVGLEYATKEGFEEAYRGEWESENAFAIDLHEQCGTELGDLENYIDWDFVARDLFLCDFYSVKTRHYTIHVFDRNC